MCDGIRPRDGRFDPWDASQPIHGLVAFTDGMYVQYMYMMMAIEVGIPWRTAWLFVFMMNLFAKILHSTSSLARFVGPVSS